MKYSIKSLLVLVLSVIFFSSCEKSAVVENEISPTAAATEVFQFTSVQHFQDYYETMNTMYDSDYATYQEIISELDINTVEKKIENDVFTDPIDRYMPFLLDPILMGLANEHFEFQINDYLFTIVNNEYILRTDANDIGLQARLRSIAKGHRLDASTIPSDVAVVTDDTFEGLMTDKPLGVKDISAPAFFKNCDKEEHIAPPKFPGAIIWDWKNKWPEDYALSTRIAIFHAWGFTYEETKTYSYVKDNNGNWSNQEIYKLRASIQGKRVASDCWPSNAENESNSCFFCKNEKARVNKRFKQRHSGNSGFAVHGGSQLTPQEGTTGGLVSYGNDVTF